MPSSDYLVSSIFVGVQNPIKALDPNTCLENHVKIRQTARRAQHITAAPSQSCRCAPAYTAAIRQIDVSIGLFRDVHERHVCLPTGLFMLQSVMFASNTPASHKLLTYVNWYDRVDGMAVAFPVSAIRCFTIHADIIYKMVHIFKIGNCWSF